MLEPLSSSGRPMWMRHQIGVLIALLAMVGCSSSPDSAPSPSGSTLAEATAVRSDVDPTDPEPVVTLGYRVYGEAQWLPPDDLQRTYLYPNGSAIQVELGGEDADDERSLQLYRLDIDRHQLGEVAALARSAGLTGGGLQPFVALPPGKQVQDGGQVVFTAKFDGLHTARIIDQLVSVEPALNRDGGRAEFAQLHDAIAQAVDGAARENLDFDRWVIVSAPLDQDEPNDPASVWSGPDIDSIDWQRIDNGADCAIVDVQDWPLGRAERDDHMVVLDQRHITRRPLLAHESTCNDVASWRSLLGL